MLEWLKRKILEYKYGPWSIRVTEEKAILLKHGKLHGSVLWKDVTRITAYKADRLTYDPIVVLLEVERNKEPLGFEELTPGYDQFVEMLRKKWSELGYNWIDTVNKTPFAPNRTVLWER